MMDELYICGNDSLELLKEAAMHMSIAPYDDCPVYIKDEHGVVICTYVNGKLVH